MTDIVAMIVEACGAGALGYVVGDIRGRYAGRSAAIEALPKGPTCNGCTHAYSFHQKDGGPCAFAQTQVRELRVIDKDRRGDPIRDRYGQVETHYEH